MYLASQHMSSFAFLQLAALSLKSDLYQAAGNRVAKDTSPVNTDRHRYRQVG